MEGTFNKIVAYEGGFTVTCAWGISPMSHADDSARAVLTALNIQKKLDYFFKVLGGIDRKAPLHIGICTGNILMSIIGNECRRKEIAIIGDTIERAFLFMQTATKMSGKIIADYDTKMEASQYMDFTYIQHIEFARKMTNAAIFEPNDVSVQSVEQSQDISFTRKSKSPILSHSKI